jgi:hypothetical protein
MQGAVSPCQAALLGDARPCNPYPRLATPRRTNVMPSSNSKQGMIQQLESPTSNPQKKTLRSNAMSVIYILSRLNMLLES